MTNKVVAMLVCFGCAAPAAAEVNFDQGVSVQSAIEQAVTSDAGIPAVSRYIGHSRYTRDCARFTFGQSDTDMISEKVWLQSTEFVEECFNHPGGGAYIPGAGGAPGHYVPAGPGGQTCYERPGQTWRESAQVKVLARKLLAWERDVVEVCMEGPWTNLYVTEGAYKYTVKRTGNGYELAPQHKVAMQPDLNGVNMLEFSYAGGKYSFTLSDKWGGEYAGEKLAVNVELFKDNPNWFDSKKGEKEFVFDAAGGYAMSFTEAELNTSKASGRDEDVRGARKFYLKWGFKRLGAISRDDFMEKGETNRVEVQ